MVDGVVLMSETHANLYAGVMMSPEGRSHAEGTFLLTYLEPRIVYLHGHSTEAGQVFGFKPIRGELRISFSGM